MENRSYSGRVLIGGGPRSLSSQGGHKTWVSEPGKASQEPDCQHSSPDFQPPASVCCFSLQARVCHSG